MALNIQVPLLFNKLIWIEYGYLAGELSNNKVIVAKIKLCQAHIDRKFREWSQPALSSSD